MKLKIRSDRVDALKQLVLSGAKPCLAIGEMCANGFNPGVSQRDFLAIASVLADYFERIGVKDVPVKRLRILCDAGPIGPYNVVVVHKRMDSGGHTLYRIGSVDVYMYDNRAVYIQYRLPPTNIERLFDPLKTVYSAIIPMTTCIEHILGVDYTDPVVLFNHDIDKLLACRAPPGEFCQLTLKDGHAYLSTHTSTVKVAGMCFGDAVLTGYWDGSSFVCVDAKTVSGKSVGRLSVSKRLERVRDIIEPIEWCTCVEYEDMSAQPVDVLIASKGTLYIHRAVPIFCFRTSLVQLCGHSLYELRTNTGELFSGTDEHRLPEAVPISTGFDHIVYWPEDELIEFYWANDGFVPMARSKAISAMSMGHACALWAVVNDPDTHRLKR